MYDSNFRFPNEEPDETTFAAKPREPRKPRARVEEAVALKNAAAEHYNSKRNAARRRKESRDERESRWN